MSESKFKTLHHIETVRNYLNFAAMELLKRGTKHDQSKLENPELDIFEEYTPKLRDLTYDSPEYQACLKEMDVAIKHHYSNNSHHPEHYANGIEDMDLFDILEMVCDWKAAGMRQNDGNILKSLEVNRKKFKINKQFYEILKNTVERYIQTWDVPNKARES